MNRDSVLRLTRKVTRGSFILLFFLVPLVFTPYNYELFEYNKMMLVYGLTVILTASFFIESVVSGKIEIKRTVLDVPLLLFLVSQILSTIFSIDTHTSLYGYYSRFHGGLLSTICYIILYYLFINEGARDRKFLFVCLKSSLISAVLISIYAILQKLGVDKAIWVQDVQNRVFSTLGQPNWLASYFAVLILILLGLTLRIKSGKKYLLLSLSLLFYAVIVFTKSRSGFVAFWVGFIVFLLADFPFKAVPQFKLKIQSLLFLIVATFLFGLPFSRLYGFTLPGIHDRALEKKSQSQETQSEAVETSSVIESGGTESGAIRNIVWQGAIDIFKHYPLLGSGVETFAYSYYQFRPVAHNATSEWDFLYNKAHNEYLNFAATTGIVGLSTYLLIIASYLFIAVKEILKKTPEKQLASAFLAAYIAILVSNFFGFSVVVIGIFFFIIPAFTFVLLEKQFISYTIVIRTSQEKALSFLQKMAVYFSFIFAFYLLFSLTQMWRADKEFNLGYQLVRTNQYLVGYNALAKAVALNPNEPFFKDELANAESLISVIAFQQKEEEMANKLRDEALSLSYELTRDYPKNLNFWKTRTKVLYNLSEVDPKYLPEALDTILKAWELAPNDAKISYNAGLLYAKNGETNKAIQTLIRSAELKPDYYEPHFALALFYEQLGEKEKAKEELNFILLKIRPDDPQAGEKLNELNQ